MLAGLWLKTKFRRKMLTKITSANLSNSQISRVLLSNFRKILMMLFPRNLTVRVKNCENYRDHKLSRKMQFWTLRIWLKLKKTSYIHILINSALDILCLVSAEPMHAEWPSPKPYQMTLQSPVTLTEVTFPIMWSKLWKEREIWKNKRPSVHSWISPQFGINSLIKTDQTVPHKSESKTRR